MEYILSNYAPESLFRYFEDICSIPHGSGNEKQIADYLCNFAKINKLFVLRKLYAVFLPLRRTNVCLMATPPHQRCSVCPIRSFLVLRYL